MSSKILSQSQALIVVPTSRSTCCPPLPKKLGFSTANTSSCFSTLTSARFSVSRVSSISFGPLIGRRSSGLVVVRAEDGGEGVGGEVSENVEAMTEAVAADDSENAEEVAEDGEDEAEAEPKPPRQPRIKLGDIMGLLNKNAIAASEEQRPVPSIRTGDIVQIKLEVPENRRRLSVYKGIVISRQNAGIHTTIRIRRIIAGIGVEIVSPLYSPNIKEIKVVAHRKVRKARLYYLRDKLPRLSTFK